MKKIRHFLNQIIDRPNLYWGIMAALIAVIVIEALWGVSELQTKKHPLLEVLGNRTSRTLTMNKKISPTKSPTPTVSPTTKPTMIPTPTTSPTATPIPAPISISGKLFGVNISGGEFGENSLPGTFNKDYTYPTDLTEYNYFSSHGLKMVRLPFRWERVQPTAMGDLNSSDIGSIKVAANVAQEAGQQVILDMHNYGRYYNTPLTKSDTAKFADAWRRLAVEFKDNTAIYGYELMNEPHDMPDGSDGWNTLAQAAVDAIRQVDTTHTILVPGYDWQSAYRWPQSNSNLNISDPAGKLVYSAHLYFDHDQSGTYTQSYDGEGAYPNVGVDRLQPFLGWLRDKGKQGMITEYGVPNNDPRWLDVLDKFMATLQSDSHIIGGTYWSGGPWWGSYPLSVEYKDGHDQPQMSILTKYPSR